MNVFLTLDDYFQTKLADFYYFISLHDKNTFFYGQNDLNSIYTKYLGTNYDTGKLWRGSYIVITF